MLPTIFEFRWDAGHMIFFGAFYAVVTVVLTGLLYVVIKSLIEVYESMSARTGQTNVSGPPSDSETQEETKEPAQETTAEA